MNKNSLKKVMSALAVAAVAASASSVAAFAADYPDGTEGYGTAADATVKPVITLDIAGKGNQVVFDKAEDIAGKEVTVSVNVSGAAGKYASTGLHVFYDKNLELVPDAKGKLAVAGDAIADLSAGKPKDDPTAPDGFAGFFAATAGEADDGQDGTMWTFTVKVPADAQKGDVFALDIIYRNEGAEDLFINKATDADGQNMQAYAFTNGIYNSKNAFAASEENKAKVAKLAELAGDMDAYIAIADTEPTTAETTTEAPATTTSGAATSAATSAKGGTTTTSTAKGSTTTTKAADAPKTGVAGCGVAVAGLAVALGTAFVLRKKED